LIIRRSLFERRGEFVDELNDIEEKCMAECPAFPGLPNAGIVNGKQVKHLNSYIAYFSSVEGDYPTSVVASTIEEAARLASMPGVISHESVQPIMVKFNKGTVAVAMPVTMIGFDIEIQPYAAKLAGAMATPEHFEVANGDKVIFQATEPFGYKFVGWQKFGPDGVDGEGNPIYLSTDLIAKFDIFDNYATKLKYLAVFEEKLTLRPGRYIDLTTGKIITVSLEHTLPNVLGSFTFLPSTVDALTFNITTCALLTGTPPLPTEGNILLTSVTGTHPSLVTENAIISAYVKLTPIGFNFNVSAGLEMRPELGECSPWLASSPSDKPIVFRYIDEL
jgi:hypothetical protein